MHNFSHCDAQNVARIPREASRKVRPATCPGPGVAGEVIGFDLKKVTPHNGDPWIMLLAVDLHSKKVWAWDLNVGEATLEHVQGKILRFNAEHELCSVAWTDNGCQFRNVVTAALESSLGIKPRFYPAGTAPSERTR